MSRKTFKDKAVFQENPALQFLTTPMDIAEETPPAQAAGEAPAPASAPDGFRVNPLYIEKKSRRMQLVLQPSLYARVQAHAKAAGVSVNEYVHALLDEATRG